ncbi:MAG TPA: hypothetical protein ENO30_06105 [Thermodesulfobium narugense]|jgi:hypothetical protein|nr:hypothetical protein [Thermodesulfobium narugense]
MGYVTLSTSVSDIEKLRRFVIDNVDAAKVDALGKEDPVDLLIRAVYGKIECRTLENNKMKFNEHFIHLYGYLIIGIHRVIFEQGGKCAKPLLDIANYLDPGISDFSILLKFYEEIYTKIIAKGGIKYEEELHNIYQNFKEYIASDNFKALLAPKVIKSALAYLGMRDLGVQDISFDEEESYVSYNDIDVPFGDEMIEKLGLVDLGVKDEQTLSSYYKAWFDNIKRDIENSRKSKMNSFLTYVDKFFLLLTELMKKIYPFILGVVITIAILVLLWFIRLHNLPILHSFWIQIIINVVSGGITQGVFKKFNKRVEWIENLLTRLEEIMKIKSSIIKNNKFIEKIKITVSNSNFPKDS